MRMFYWPRIWDLVLSGPAAGQENISRGSPCTRERGNLCAGSQSCVLFCVFPSIVAQVAVEQRQLPFIDTPVPLQSMPHLKIST